MTRAEIENAPRPETPDFCIAGKKVDETASKSEIWIKRRVTFTVSQRKQFKWRMFSSNLSKKGPVLLFLEAWWTSRENSSKNREQTNQRAKSDEQCILVYYWRELSCSPPSKTAADSAEANQDNRRNRERKRSRGASKKRAFAFLAQLITVFLGTIPTEAREDANARRAEEPRSWKKKDSRWLEQNEFGRRWRRVCCRKVAL